MKSKESVMREYHKNVASTIGEIEEHLSSSIKYSGFKVKVTSFTPESFILAIEDPRDSEVYTESSITVTCYANGNNIDIKIKSFPDRSNMNKPWYSAMRNVYDTLNNGSTQKLLKYKMTKIQKLYELFVSVNYQP